MLILSQIIKISLLLNLRSLISCSQQSATREYREVHESSQRHTLFFKEIFYIILPSANSSLKYWHPVSSYKQILAYTLHHNRLITAISCGAVQDMQFSQDFFNVLDLWIMFTSTTCSQQHSFYDCLYGEEPNFTPILNNMKYYCFVLW
jgi:hypothetical protein